jgi:hypothetical protein
MAYFQEGYAQEGYAEDYGSGGESAPVSTRAFILSPYNSDLSITGSSAIANAGASNLLLARPKLYWRSTNATPYLQGILRGDDVDTFVLGFTNGRTHIASGVASPADTIRVRLADVEANLLSGPLYDSADFDIYPTGANWMKYAKIHRVKTFPIVTGPLVYRIDFSFSNPDGYVQAARIMLGKRIEPEVSVKTGWSMGGSEEVVETTDMGGEESPREVGTKRQMTATWHNLTEAEREQIYELVLERGSAKDICLAIEPSEGKYAMSRVYIGRIKDAWSFQQTLSAGGPEDTDQRFTVSVTVKEMAPGEMR